MLSLPTKAMAVHISKVINNLTLSILVRCSYFAFPIGLRNPFTYMSNGSELNKRNPKMDDILEKMCAFTRGLSVPWKEELTGPFSLPRILDEGEFNEALNLNGTLQWTTFAEPSSFAKEITKVTEDSSLKSTVDPSGGAPKDPKKRVRSFLSLKTSTAKTLE